MTVDSLLFYLPQFSMMLMTGLLGGFLSGLFGVGGGAVFVPALYLAAPLLGWNSIIVMHMAIGTSFGIVLATALASSRSHHRRRAVDVNILRLWSPFIFSGVAAGLLIAAQAPASLLKNVFAVLLLALAGYMAWPHKKEESHDMRMPMMLQRIWCFLVGFVSSMSGIGGAILNVPFLKHMGLPIHRAVGTAAGLVIAAAVPGLVGYAVAGIFFHHAPLPSLSLGYVSLPALLLMTPPSVMAAPLGAKLSHRLPPRGLSLFFACFLLISSLCMLLEK